MLGLMAVFLAIFTGLQLWLHPEITAETLIIRATGTLAFLMLHVILCIGPLARLDSRFLPLLYNRRHLGGKIFRLGNWMVIYKDAAKKPVLLPAGERMEVPNCR